MDIDILEFVEGAKRATGLTVVIDVFRAFSVACYAYDAGASRVIATSSVDDAVNLAKKYRNAVLAGERNESKIAGFDLGNSPTEILQSNLAGVTFIHTTTAGTQGLVNAVNSSPVITGSLVNAEAVVKYIKSVNPEKVSLVAMGYRTNESAEEDLLCARLIESRLKDERKNFSEQINSLRDTSGKRFFDPRNLEFSPPTDYFLCTITDRFNFVLQGNRRPDGNIDLLKTDL
jgi:2-phosphosulfolactate phosphatase